MDTPFRELQADQLASMTASERAEYEAQLEVEETRLSLSSVVYQARSDAHLTQAALAERSGISRSAISSIETGAHIPTVATMQRIAAGVGGKLVISMTPTS